MAYSLQIVCIIYTLTHTSLPITFLLLKLLLLVNVPKFWELFPVASLLCFEHLLNITMIYDLILQILLSILFSKCNSFLCLFLSISLILLFFLVFSLKLRVFCDLTWITWGELRLSLFFLSFLTQVGASSCIIKSVSEFIIKYIDVWFIYGCFAEYFYSRRPICLDLSIILILLWSFLARFGQVLTLCYFTYSA